MSAHEQKATLLDDRKATIQSLTQTAASQIRAIVAEEKNGTLTKEAAQEKAKSAIRSLRYDGKEYFWISSTDGQAVMHPILPELETQDISATKKNVYDLFFAMGKAVAGKPDGTYYSYQWPKAGDATKTPYPKISYVIPIAEWGWVVGTGLYVDNVEQAFFDDLISNIVRAAAIITLSLGALLFLSRGISRPLHELTDMLPRITRGETSLDVPHRNRKDEIGTVAQAVEMIRTQEIAKADAQQERARLDTIAVEERKALLQKIASTLSAQTDAFISEMGGFTRNLAGSAQDMSASAVQSRSKLTGVANDADSTATNVQTMASASEELSATNQNIQRQIEHTKAMTEDANSAMGVAGSTMTELKSAAEKIGDIISLIQNIAGQTNLLALNATIEAARAGDAGKGFAVVASEVKDLAGQTNQATEEITRQIEAIQRLVNSVLTAMTQVSDAMGKMKEGNLTVAHNVVEQVAASAEIARSSQEAALQTDRLRDDITDFRKTTELIEEKSHQLLQISATIQGSNDSLHTKIRELVQNIQSL